MYINFLIEALLIGSMLYVGLFRSSARDQAKSSEVAGRSVLIGTFCLTGHMFLQAFFREGKFPEVPNGVLTFNGLAVAIYLIIQLLASADAGRESRIRLTEAQHKALEHPDNVGYAWNLASATLEHYLDQNLSQVKWIFNIAVLMMICGFAIIGYGVSLALQPNSDLGPGIVTSASGLLTQFMSVTVMFIYRSTMAQASANVVTLERLNSISMAVQLLDKMSNETPDSKNDASAEIIRSLIAKAARRSKTVSHGNKALPKRQEVQVADHMSTTF